MKHSKAQIVATIGPSSAKHDVLKEMILHNMDVARFNFSWSNIEERKIHIKLIRDIESELNVKIPIIEDLPGPRIQKEKGHTYVPEKVPTEHDIELIKFGIENNLDYIALSFVGDRDEIKRCKEIIKENSGTQKVIAKIERAIAVENIDGIIEEADAVMVARGDLGEEIPLEKIPFIQEKIIKKCKLAGKPVITATQMMLSMVDNSKPTRAEVTDVANAILEGSDAVMLSEETTIGKYPVETVTMMEKIILEAESHMEKDTINHL
ncbi:MAG: pyruvate kinase [Patescibacteria group bacterium]|nr:pyruvate kinase [Patescibacteria group bacterium]